MFTRRAALIVLVMIMVVGTTIQPQAAPQVNKDPIGPVEVSSAVYSDVSAPVRDLVGVAPTASTDKEKKEKPLRVLPNKGNALKQADGALQTLTGPTVATTAGLNFPGVGNGDY